MGAAGDFDCGEANATGRGKFHGNFSEVAEAAIHVRQIAFTQVVIFREVE